MQKQQHYTPAAIPILEETMQRQYSSTPTLNTIDNAIHTALNEIRQPANMVKRSHVKDVDTDSWLSDGPARKRAKLAQPSQRQNKSMPRKGISKNRNAKKTLSRKVPIIHEDEPTPLGMLGKLPLELRQEIWRLSVPDEIIVAHSDDFKDLSDDLRNKLDIFTTSKPVREEALEALYKYSIFNFWLGRSINQSDTLEPCHPTRQQCWDLMKIKNVHIELGLDEVRTFLSSICLLRLRLSLAQHNLGRRKRTFVRLVQVPCILKSS